MAQPLTYTRRFDVVLRNLTDLVNSAEDLLTQLTDTERQHLSSTFDSFVSRLNAQSDNHPHDLAALLQDILETMRQVQVWESFFDVDNQLRSADESTVTLFLPEDRTSSPVSFSRQTESLEDALVEVSHALKRLDDHTQST